MSEPQGDVVVKVGGNATPFKQMMEQVRESAKKTGETLGVELGTKAGFREEARFEKGLDGLLKGMANAKDPLSAFSAGIEGLGQTFRIAGGAMIAFAIGNFIRDQLTQAAESATDFYEKTDQIFAVTKHSSKAFAEEAVKGFQEAEKAYEKEGFLEKLIYGAGQRKTLESGRVAMEKALAGQKEAREAGYRDEALANSTELWRQQQAATDAVNDEYDEKVAKATEAGDDITNLEIARHEKLQAVGAEFLKKQEALNKPGEETAAEARKLAQEKGRAIQEEREKQQKLDDEANVHTLTQKMAAIQKQIDQNKLLANNTSDELEIQKRITAQKELQNQLTEAATELANRKAEILKAEANNAKEQDQVRQEMREAQANAMGFHGVVDSYRKQGFAGRVGTNQNSEQVRAIGDLGKKMDKLVDASHELNSKLDAL